MRIAVYARVSTDEQRDGKTINSQVSELELHAHTMGWCVTDIYKDEGWSGSQMARPELDRLRDGARLGRFQAVLINDVDRLARDVAHLGVIKRDLEKSNVRVIFRKLPSETSPISNLMVNILGSFAEFERELIMDRTRRGRRHKVEHRKQYLGSNTAYGYRYQRMDRINGRLGHLGVDPQEARVVRPDL
jgi:site-specific DNA recombinase